MQMRKAHQRNKDLDEEFCWAKSMWESANSKLTGELNKAREEL